MAITVVETQIQTQPSARSRSLTFDASWDPQIDDLVVIWCTASGPNTITTPATWVNVQGGNNIVMSDSNAICCVYHWVTSAEASANTLAYNVNAIFNTAIDGATGGIVLRGVNTTTPVDSFSTTFDSANAATPHILPGLTGANLSTGSMVFSGIIPDGGQTYTTPSGWTMQINLTTGTTGRFLWVGSRNTLTTAGTDIPNTNITPSSGDEYAAITVAFTAATPVAPPAGGGSFFPFFPSGNTVTETVIHDAGLNETFVFAPEPTGTVRSIVDFGATANNSSNDDKTAIVNAIAASSSGDVVLIPNGTFTIKGTTAISAKAGVTIRGESQAGAIISTAYTASPIGVFFVGDGVSDTIFENFTILKESGSNFLAGIRYSAGNTAATAVAVQRSIIRHVTIRHHQRFGVELHNTKHVLVENCNIKDAVALDGNGSGYGVVMSDPMCNNNWARNNLVGPVIRHGLLIQFSAHHNLLDSNEVVGAVSGAIDMHGEDEYSNEIRYNIVHDSVRNGTTISPNGGGIELGEANSGDHDDSGPYNWVHHNEVYNCPMGIYVQNKTTYTYIEDNNFHNNDIGIWTAMTSGYPLAAINDIIIQRNTIQNNLDGILLVDGVNRAVVEDNIITGNTGYGIHGDSLNVKYRIRDNTITGNGTNVQLDSTDGIYIP